MIPKPQHSYNVLLDEAHKTYLDVLKETTGLAGSLLIRTALASMYQHVIHGRPSCASGSPCLCADRWLNVRSGTVTTNTLQPTPPAPTPIQQPVPTIQPTP